MLRFVARAISALAVIYLALCSLPAAARQDPQPVRRAIEEFLRVQIKGLPGQASFSIGSLEALNNLTPCPVIDVALPAGARAWGRTSVVVRCQAENVWSIYVPVQVRVIGEYLLTARALSQGQVVVEADLARIRGDLTDLPAGVLTDAVQALGKVVAQSVTSGRPLRADMLRQVLVVQAGQSVKLTSSGPGFQVSGAEGRALANAAEGQVVQVRLVSGRIISGIARTGGAVEVSY